MEEGGIADGGNHIPLLAGHSVGMVEACCLTYGCPHAKHGINGTQVNAKGVTADVTGVDSLWCCFFDGIETGPVRAARAKCRPPSTTCRWARHGRNRNLGKTGNDTLDQFGKKFSRLGNSAGQFATHLGAVAELHFNYAGGLFQNEDLIKFAQKLGSEVSVQGIGLEHLEKGELIPQSEIFMVSLACPAAAPEATIAFLE